MMAAVDLEVETLLRAPLGGDWKGLRNGAGDHGPFPGFLKRTPKECRRIFRK